MSVDAEIIFGSSVRRDADSLSDRDILIIDSDVKRLRDRSSQLKLEGWSVASYTWKRFDRLIQSGSLFVQHLKSESEVLKDQNFRFRDRLSGFAPKASYAQEIADNWQFLDLVRQTPKSGRGVLWCMDVLFVVIRNYGILRLATDGRYVFSFSEVISALAQAGHISEESAGRLRRLRFLKSLYRSKTYPPLPSLEGKIRETVDAVPFEKFAETWELADAREILTSKSRSTQDSSSYFRLRELEKFYVAAESVSPSIMRDPRFEKLRTWVSDPRCYACLAATNFNETMFAIRDTRSLGNGVDRRRINGTS